MIYIIRGPILSIPVSFLTFICDKNLLTKVIFVNGILNSISASLSEIKVGSLRLEATLARSRSHQNN